MAPSRKQRKIRGRNTLNFTRLEPRHLLAADFVITEFLASNDSGLVNDNLNSSDWIEIHNAGTMSGSLSGFTLTDDASQTDLFTLPAVNVAAGGYLIVYADTDAAPASGNDIYTGFKLSAGGEYLGLYDPSGNVVSEFGSASTDYPTQHQDVSYGLVFSGSSIATPLQEGYFSAPTPGLPNGSQTTGIASDVSVSTASGFYDSAFQVTLTTDTPNSTIRYTLDGSAPSATNGLVYGGPLSITGTTNLRAIATSPGYELTHPDTWTYIFVDDVLEQSNQGQAPAGWPADWGQDTDYGIDPDVRNRTDAHGGDQNIKDALLSIPTWSITTDLDNLFGSTGIYTNALQDGRAWERPASVELINPDGSEGFQVNAGLRIRGGFSRLPTNPKHSFRLLFRSEYGDSKLEYPVHGDRGVDVFDKIDLRTAQNRSWNSTSGEKNNFIIEQFNRENQLVLGQPSTRSSWLHLYLNGQYWGLYQTQERSDSDFAADYLGGDPDDFDVIKPDAGPNRPYINVATSGNLAAYTALHQQAVARAADGTTPAFVSNAAYYRAQGLNPDGSPNANFETLLDVDNLIDYMANILYSANADAPIARWVENNAAINNYIAIRDRTGNEGFQYFVHDSELSFISLNENRNGPFNFPVYEANADRFNPQWLHQQLMANAEYRIAFADRIQETYFNDGPLTTQNMLARFDQLASQIDQAIIAESARWGDAQRSNPRLRSDWLNAVATIRDGIIAQRHPVFINQLKNTVLRLRSTPSSSTYSRTVAAPLFPNIDPPTFSIEGLAQHGGVIDSGDNLGISGSGGTIYYTTDGSDPRNVGGSINSAAQIYDSTSNSTTLFNTGSAWSYLDTGTSLDGMNWQDANFNDSAWSTGIGEFGYGDGTQQTLIDYGNSASNKHITTYFRKQFQSTGNYVSATLQLRRDDGVVVYVNGTEVGRNNLPNGPIAFSTTANSAISGSAETQFINFNINPNLLVAGTNTIAVEIHQANSGSSDLRFDARLTAVETSSNNAITETTPILSRIRSSNGTWSALQSAVFFVPGEAASSSNLRITEINYNPTNGDAEFIELQNINPAGGAAIDLSGVTLTDGPSVPLTLAQGTTLAAGQFGLLVKDIAAFTATYPSVDPASILGIYSGGLSNSGEGITLLAADAGVIADFQYNDTDPFPFAANGRGFSLVLNDDVANTPANELGKYYSWRASTTLGGTPGTASVDRSGVVINEILAHTDAPQSDSIELFNSSGTAIDLGGWYLSDASSDLLKFQIPTGTTISAGGYLVFDESDFNPNGTGFALSGSEGDQVYLSQAAGGTFIGLEDAVEFSATFNGESLGRLPNGSGRLTRLASNSLGSANGDAEVGPLVISEINYHPETPSAAALAIAPSLTDNDLEYIEIANPTSGTIDLTNWRLRGESDYDFAAGTSLAPAQALIVVTFDPAAAINAAKLAAFKAHYGISTGVTIVGALSGSLSNSFGRISLQQPDTPDSLGAIPNVVVDEVVYDDLAPWGDADGSGQTLARDTLAANGSLVSSWIAATPTPGVFEDDFLLGDVNQDGVVNFLDIAPFISILQNQDHLDEADINGDGVVNFLDISSFIDLLANQ